MDVDSHKVTVTVDFSMWALEKEGGVMVGGIYIIFDL
jgi:hypothetical protein